MTNEQVAGYEGLIHACLRSVTAARSLPAWVEHDDLVSCAWLGLLKAEKKWNPDLGPFITFAWFRIVGEVLDYFRRSDPLSRNTRSLIRRVEATSENLADKHGRTLTEEEIAVELGISDQKVKDARAAEQSRYTVSLDAFVFVQKEEWILSEIVEDPRSYADRTIDLIDLRNALPLLSDNSRRLLSQVLSGVSGEEMAAERGVGASRVSQMVKQARDELLALVA